MVISSPNLQAASSRGWILHFRAAGRNLGFHLPQVAYLALAGFRVALFDYAGSGRSTGRTSFTGLVADGEALLEALHREGAERVFLFGQGAGADAAVQLLSAHRERVVGVALESAWATRTGWVRERWGFGVGNIAAKALAGVAVEPGSVLAQTQRPILLIEPEHDDFIRRGERKTLERGIGKNVTLWRVEGAKHLGVFGIPSGGTAQREREKRLVQFVDKAFASA